MRSSTMKIIVVFWIFLSTIPLVLLLPGFAAAETATIRDGRSTVQVDSIAFPTDQSLPIQTEKIDKVGEKLGDKIDKVGSRASLQFGHWVKKEAFMGITWLKLFACALLLLFIIALDRVFRAWLTKMQRKAQLREGQTTWSTASLGAILGPVSMWRPFCARSARIHWLDPGVFILHGRRVAAFVCYEQVLAWPVLISMITDFRAGIVDNKTAAILLAMTTRSEYPQGFRL